MLRRTRADQVVPVYKKFTSKYITPDDASKLKKSELENILYPLGLHWRAEQLHDTIHYLKDNFSKRDPSEKDNLKNIPGVGDYAEAMLRNRLFNERTATVDSNVVRVFSRWLDVPLKMDARRDKGLIRLANRFVNSKNSKELNLALLDFSALICRPGKPDCVECILAKECETGRSR